MSAAAQGNAAAARKGRKRKGSPFPQTHKDGNSLIETQQDAFKRVYITSNLCKEFSLWLCASDTTSQLRGESIQKYHGHVLA